MHLAIIMDGNRRWARQHGTSVAAGYRAGMRACIRVLDWGNARNIEVITLFAFSSDNWRRPQSENSAIFWLAFAFSLGNCARFIRQGVRVRVVGNMRPVPVVSRVSLQALEWLTRHGRKMEVNFLVNYSGRVDIVDAIRAIALQVADRTLDPDSISEDTIASSLSTASCPDPDVVIRSGQESRLSNFMLYEIAESRLVFVEKLWPDIMPEDMDAIMASDEISAASSPILVA